MRNEYVEWRVVSLCVFVCVHFDVHVSDVDVNFTVRRRQPLGVL